MSFYIYESQASYDYAGCLMAGPCPVGLVVSVSTSHTVGREFASRPGHTKDHHKLPPCMARNALG